MVVKNIAVVDRHTLFSDGLSRIINEQDDMECIGKFKNFEELAKFDRVADIDVLIIDPSEKPSDYGHIARFKERWQDCAVFILTHNCRNGSVVKYLDIGVCGYVSKEIETFGLIDTIRLVSDDPSMVSIRVEKCAFSGIASLVKEGATKRGLGDRELQVLKLLANGKNNREIGNILYISTHTVGVHVASIFQKLGVNSRTQAISRAMKEGLITTDDLEEIDSQKPSVLALGD